MFLHRVAQALGLQFLEGIDDARTCVAGLDNVIDISTVGSLIRTGEEFIIFGLLLGDEFLLFFSILDGLDSLFSLVSVDVLNGCWDRRGVYIVLAIKDYDIL